MYDAAAGDKSSFITAGKQPLTNQPALLEKIQTINQALDQRFRDGNDPFQIVTRLAEECGELAAQVNHFEGRGVKREKHGEPDRMKLAKEVQDVIRCALQVANHYAIQDELGASVERDYRRAVEELRDNQARANSVCARSHGD